VKISHANGGTSEILPSAITDAPNPLVQEYPAYHDVRVKSVRILGLQDGDTIEYRVITTTTKTSLGAGFSGSSTRSIGRDRCSRSTTKLICPIHPLVTQINPATPATKIDHEKTDNSVRSTYRWGEEILC